jgi:hypothetical protein
MDEFGISPPKGRRKYKDPKRSGTLRLIVVGGSIFVVIFMTAIFVLAAFF